MIVTFFGYITKSLKRNPDCSSPSRVCDVEVGCVLLTLADTIKRVENDRIRDVWVVSTYKPAALQGSHSAYDPNSNPNIVVSTHVCLSIN
jgi:hypothetical protein